MPVYPKRLTEGPVYFQDLKLYQSDTDALSLTNLPGNTHENLKLGTYEAHAHSTNTVGAIYQSQKSRGTAGSPTIVATGDLLREDRAYGYDGANYLFMGASYFRATGTIAATRVPTQWEVWIASDAAPSVLAKSAVLSSAITAFGSYALNSNTTGNNNSAFGLAALNSNTTGNNNSAFGSYALNSNTTGNNNSAFGLFALYSNTGDSNSAFGSYALNSNTTGNNNSAFGLAALNSNTTGNNNSAFGSYALNSNNGSSNVALGYRAGYYETGSSKLFVDNDARANEADGRLKALIYGVFNATPANQLLVFNAMVQLGVNMKLGSTSGVIGLSVVSTALTLGSAGSIIHPSADMGNAATDAARDALAGNVNGAVAIDSVGVAGVFKIWCRVGGVWKSATLS